MTELEQVQYAKMFLDKMAAGINPLDNTKIKADDLLMNKRIAGCMAYVSKLLDDVIETKAKQIRKENQIPLDVNQLDSRGIVFSPNAISVSTFITNLKGMYGNVAMTRLKRGDFMNWMLSQGIVEEVSSGEHKQVLPTAKGKQMGIFIEQRVNSKGESYQGVFYPLQIQKYLASKIPEIIMLKQSK